MPQAEQAELSKRLARVVEESFESEQTQVSWEQDGKLYSATLIRERANEGTALDRVIAEVSASDHGRQLTTRVQLKRLAFSQFSQMVDHWDPMVQLHDDEIVGRFHTNSQFNVMYDSRTAPKFLGKVTTAARTFSTESIGRRREADIFQGGLETRAGRIPLPEELQPFEWAPREANARTHEFASDARIRFYADGSYTWRIGDSAETHYLNAPSDHPVYFIAANGVTLYVAGVVAGKILVYSPRRIVVEGSLTYAHDPRDSSDSNDYLGLVCDRYIEVAPPGVTGPGILRLTALSLPGAASWCRTSTIRRSATLRIYGSLAAGSLSASEPRYATRSSMTSASSDVVRRVFRRRIGLRSTPGTVNGGRPRNVRRTKRSNRAVEEPVHGLFNGAGPGRQGIERVFQPPAGTALESTRPDRLAAGKVIEGICARVCLCR